MCSTENVGEHCFANIRLRNCIGKEEEEELPKVPLRFKQDASGLDERLAMPGINWKGFINLRNRFFLSFTESLDEAIEKKAACHNLSISRESIDTVRERYSVQLFAATAKTPSLKKTFRRVPLKEIAEQPVEDEVEVVASVEKNRDTETDFKATARQGNKGVMVLSDLACETLPAPDSGVSRRSSTAMTTVGKNRNTATDFKARTRQGSKEGMVLTDLMPETPPAPDSSEGRKNSITDNHQLLKKTKKLSVKLSKASISRSSSGSAKDKVDSSNESQQETFVSPLSPQPLEISAYYTCPEEPLQTAQSISPTAVPYLKHTPLTLLKQQQLNATYVICPETPADQLSPVSGMLPNAMPNAPRQDLCATTVIKSRVPPWDNLASTNSPKPRPTPALLDFDAPDQVLTTSGAGIKRQRSLLAERVSPQLTSPPKQILLSPEIRKETCSPASDGSQKDVASFSPEGRGQSCSPVSGVLQKGVALFSPEGQRESYFPPSGGSQKDIASMTNLTSSEGDTGPSHSPECMTTQQRTGTSVSCHISPSLNGIPQTKETVEQVHSASPPPSDTALSTRPTFLKTWAQMNSSKPNLRKPAEMNLNLPKSFLPPAPVRNSPHRQELERRQRKEDMKARLAKKKEEEERRQQQLQSKREQERLDKIRKQEEKRRRVAEKQAALEKQVVAEKEKKLAQVQSKVDQKKEMLSLRKAQEKEERNRRQRERMVAVEQRRKKEEEAKRTRLQKKLEEEQRILEETQKKKMELEEEERQRKKQEKIDQERERQRQKELERKKKEEAEERLQRVKQAEVRPAQPKKNVTDSDECKQLLLQLKQFQEEKKARLVGNTIAASSASKERPQPESIGVESSRNTTPPAEVVGTAFTGSTGETMVVTSQVETDVTPAPTEKKKLSKYADISSYEITPAHKDVLAMADDNYNIADISSGDSTDDEDCPKKSVPKWAASASVFQIMREQEKKLESKKINIDSVFPPDQLLCQPELARIFKEKRRRFYKRTSSAHWMSPMLKKSRSYSDN